MDTPCIIVAGNLADGFRFVGPFPSFDEAAEYAERFIDDNTWISTLDAPGDEREPTRPTHPPGARGNCQPGT